MARKYLMNQETALNYLIANIKKKDLTIMNKMFKYSNNKTKKAILKELIIDIKKMSINFDSGFINLWYEIIIDVPKMNDEKIKELFKENDSYGYFEYFNEYNQITYDDIGIHAWFESSDNLSTTEIKLIIESRVFVNFPEFLYNNMKLINSYKLLKDEITKESNFEDLANAKELDDIRFSYLVKDNYEKCIDLGIQFNHVSNEASRLFNKIQEKFLEEDF